MLGDMAVNGASDTAYLFTQDGASWAQMTKMQPGTGANSQFGSDVALTTHAALIGAPGASTAATSGSGAAQVFTVGKENGDPCVADSDCATEHCVDQVCCASSCTELCQACAAALKTSGVDGACGPAKAGIDPHDQCDGQPATTCGLPGVCDGAGSCITHYPAGTECLSTSCQTTTAANLPHICDGSGNCFETGVVACKSGYGCVGGACKTSCLDDGDCVYG